MAKRARGLLARLFNWEAVAALVALLTWFDLRPADLLTALLRARDAVVSLVPDVPTITTGVLTDDVCRVAGESLTNNFENMNVSDCNTMVRMVTNTSLTPVTGQLRFNFYASLDPAAAHATATIANATQTNSTIQ